MNEKVTVIVPFHNGNKYLSFTLESIFSQQHFVIDVIIVQDIFSEAPLIDKKYKEKVRILCNGTQVGGAGIVRWIGATYATGDWVAFCDADDLWSKSKLEEQIFLMKRDGLHFSFGGFSHFRHINSGSIVNSRVFMPAAPYSLDGLLKKKFVVPCFTVLLSKKAAALVRPNKLKRRNDYLMWFNLIHDLESRNLGWGGLPVFSGWHRLHSEALTSSRVKSVQSQFVFYRSCGFNLIATFKYMMHYLYRTIGSR